jgi:hypothetical protein
VPVKSFTYVRVYPVMAVTPGGDCPDGSDVSAAPSGTATPELDA